MWGQSNARAGIAAPEIESSRFFLFFLSSGEGGDVTLNSTQKNTVNTFEDSIRDHLKDCRAKQEPGRFTFLLSISKMPSPRNGTPALRMKTWLRCCALLQVACLAVSFTIQGRASPAACVLRKPRRCLTLCSQSCFHCKRTAFHWEGGAKRFLLRQQPTSFWDQI